jgi:hypothetical protein
MRMRVRMRMSMSMRSAAIEDGGTVLIPSLRSTRIVKTYCRLLLSRMLRLISQTACVATNYDRDRRIECELRLSRIANWLVSVE